ncbi:hypothetical protein [Isoptericola sp. NPDC056605]|uniref:hypothetical protein n=1 Tax=Isoptericola sp. NPDC056605 TaxID=3345876 RepID=UPI0036B49AA8
MSDPTPREARRLLDRAVAVQMAYLVAIVAFARHRERAAWTVPRGARRIAVVAGAWIRKEPGR